MNTPEEKPETQRHENLRQGFLDDAPEGREPKPHIRRRSWIFFHALLAVALIGMMTFLWWLGGWPFLILGMIFTIGLYFLGFWADYLAIGFRLRDKRRADRKATIVEKFGARR